MARHRAGRQHNTDHNTPLPPDSTTLPPTKQPHTSANTPHTTQPKQHASPPEQILPTWHSKQAAWYHHSTRRCVLHKSPARRTRRPSPNRRTLPHHPPAARSQPAPARHIQQQCQQPTNQNNCWKCRSGQCAATRPPEMNGKASHSTLDHDKTRCNAKQVKTNQWQPLLQQPYMHVQVNQVILLTTHHAPQTPKTPTQSIGYTNIQLHDQLLATHKQNNSVASTLTYCQNAPQTHCGRQQSPDRRPWSENVPVSSLHNVQTKRGLAGQVSNIVVIT